MLTAEQDLREFRDPYAYVGWDEFTASAVVMPATVEAVQADEKQTTRTHDAYGELVTGMAAAGYGLYRTNLRYMDLVAEQYDSQGKQGIWPRSMRS